LGPLEVARWESFFAYASVKLANSLAMFDA
jgi:hypothetical protein